MPINQHSEAETSTLRQFLEANDAHMRATLLRVDELERDFSAIKAFEYRTAMPMDTTEFALDGKKLLDASGHIPPGALAAHVYNVGRTANLIHALMWTKKKAIAECLKTFQFSLTQGSIVPALVLTRTILEHVGVIALVDRDLSHTKREGDSPNAHGDWVLDVQIALIPLVMGTRIDWADYFGSGLKGKRRKGYKAQEGYFDQEAKGLLKGIDLLDKAVPGTRNAYEFLSEFGHPNYPSFQLGVASAEITKHRHGFRMLKKVYAGDRVPRVGVGELQLLLRDVWDILVAALERLQVFDTALAELENEVRKATRLWVRKSMRRWSEVYRPGDPCPCLSGRIVSGCCGK